MPGLVGGVPSMGTSIPIWGPVTSSVGIGTSSVPYGAFGSYANSNTGVWGFKGPAIGSLQQPKTWYVRKGGADTNGGDTNALSPERSGSDGVGNGTTTFTSATAAFTSADVGRGISITAITYKILVVTNSTTVTVNAVVSSSSGKQWAIGGAWLTIGQSIQPPAGTTTQSPSPGDTIYIGAGTYRETISVGTATGWVPSFNGTVNIVGDVSGQYTGDAGMVQLTAYTTNDKTAPSATTLLNLNGKSNLSFSNIMFVGGTGIVVTATTAVSQNVSFTDCTLLSPQQAGAFLVSHTGVANVISNWLLNRCYLRSLRNGAIVTLTWPTSGNGADYDVNIYGGAAVGMSANTSGQILEAYNLIICSTARTNVTTGTGSISDGSYAPLFHFGQETQWGGLLRRFGEPMAGSPLLGFGSQDPIASNPLDLRGFPRPAGLGAAGSQLPAVGALERANTSVQATTPAPPSGTYVWQFTGPGYQDFLLPVDTTSTTVSCTVQRDANYTGDTPMLHLLANPSLGVVKQTVSDTGGTGTNNTLTLAPFAATAAGAVTIRVMSGDLSGTSIVAFSVFTVT